MGVISPILDFINICEGQGKKRSGILASIPPVIPAPCDCYDTLIIPFFIVKNLAKSAIKETGERLFGGALKSIRLSFLDSKWLPIISAYERQYEKLAKMFTRRKELGIRITASEYRKTILEQRLRNVIEGELGLNEIASIIKNEKKRIKINEKFLDSVKKNGKLPWFNPSTGDLNFDYPPVRKIIEDIANSYKTIDINELLRIEKIKEQAELVTDIAKEEIEINKCHKIKEFLDNQEIIEEENMIPLKKAKEEMEKDINNVKETGGPLIDDKYPELASNLLDYIINALNMIDLVEKHNCQDPSMLNQTTCECSECPSGKSLCKPLLAPDIGVQLPLTEMGDELNNCLDDCCGGSELKPNLSSLSSTAGIFYHPCSCQCPNIAGPGNEEQEFKPCDNNQCSNGVCAQKYPPDIDPNAWFPPPSKYEWSSFECNWVCKDGECPGPGQYRGPGCVCICESAEDAGCFAPNTWRTTSDAITGEAISCECLCLSPNELCGGKCYTPCSSGQLRVNCECCTPTCTEGLCGSDGCGGTCPCPSGNYSCVDGVCQECTPTCTEGLCGSDGCGGTCPCPSGNYSCVDGVCQECTPTCTEDLCGSDGCGGTCPCPSGNYSCVDGVCQCNPSCTEGLCGSDGCGGTCPCPSGNYSCVDGVCVPAKQDCVVSDWSAWGTCSKTCGGGTQSRTRTIVTPAADGGTACPSLSESRDCNTQACDCPQCSVSLTCVNSGSYFAWGAASAISSACPENVFCSNKAPNIPGTGYWGCCSTVGDTVTYTFDCPDCSGNPGPYSSCNPPTPTPTTYMPFMFVSEESIEW
jgi:hypothetical protein